MPDRDKVIKGLEHCADDGCKDCPYIEDCRFMDCFTVLARDTLTLLKDSEQNEGWICEKRNSGRQITDLLCACGNKVYFTTLLFKDGFTVNELYCPNCGLSMRSPHHDKDGVWLRKHWKEVVLKAREPRVMTLEETGKADISWLELKDMNHVMPCRIRYSDGWFIKLFEGSPEWFAESEYGTEFRCWTSRPTDEQRRETPWEKG